MHQDKLLRSILEGRAEDVAPRLLGCTLTRYFNGKKAVVKIVETESYHQSDAASHSYNGKTPRTEVMFGEPGKLYVYFTYGMHYCCNVVTGKSGEGSAVLIRAVEPISGEKILMKNRKNLKGHSLTNGPAKLCQALLIDKSLNGHDLSAKPLILEMKDSLPKSKVTATTRIGISKAANKPWRFYMTGNPYVSKP